MYKNDHRIVLTLDAGGTNFVFSAIKGLEEIMEPVRLPSITDDSNQCLDTLVDGFRQVMEKLNEKPVAISFAFPGPADYEHGIIGNLPNFPGFRGGVALGPYLSHIFGLPVYINNDGNLYAYGEAIAGLLPEVNARLKFSGSKKRYHNLIGLTIGTGFGGGVVLDGHLLRGDNGCGGDVWLMRHLTHPELITEEGVSSRAICYLYEKYSGVSSEKITPKDIFEIADGSQGGDAAAARRVFQEMGVIAGEAIVHALDIADGLVVIGGGIANSWKFFLPSLVKHCNTTLANRKGEQFSILQMKMLNLEDPVQAKEFYLDHDLMIPVKDSDQKALYQIDKKTAVAVSRIGTNKAIALGAYAFALAELDRSN